MSAVARPSHPILFNLGVAMNFMKQDQPELNFAAQMG